MRTQLDAIYEHEKNLADQVWLTQPMGKGVLHELTWRQAIDEARRMAAHLRAQQLPAGSRIAIFAKNNAWWFLADLAIWMSGHVSVPIYPTLTADSIRQILKHSATRLIFIGKLDGFPAMAPGIPDDVKRIVLPLGPGTDGARWEDIVKQTSPITDSPRRDPDDLATIIYTSGSTGVPKGVMHSFRTMCSAAQFVDRLGLSPQGRAISYLPLAHVAERALLETPNFLCGGHIFFAESLDTFIDDVKRAQPTVFGSVPRLWMKFQSGVHAKMPPARLRMLLKLPIIGALVQKKVLAGLGLTHVKQAVCGSAPIPTELIAWYRALGIEIDEVYGMTENFAISHMGRRGENKPGYVGKTLEGVQHRIGDDGEVIVKSPGTMLGYYEAPELTAEVLDKDGWLRTGDRGEVDAEGRIRITGRVKELFKTSKGKYVAPAPIENKLLADPLIEQACVAGANMQQPFALVVLAPIARSQGAGNTDALARLRRLVNDALDPHEQLEKIVVASEEWTIENGLLTPTLKLKRSAIESRYAPQVERWYKEREAVVWMDR